MVTTPDTSTVARVAAILHTLGASDEHGELSVSEIARHVGRERSQISRMLKALAAAGLVEQNPETRAYRLGWQLYVLAAKVADQQLLRVGSLVLRALVAETRETALLSVLQDNRSFSLLRERSLQSLQAGGWVGRTSPLHITASGRALLLDSTDDEVRGLIIDDLDASGYGPNAMRSIPEVLDRLHQERDQGYTVANEELEVGLVAIAAPVRDATDRIIASVNVSGPTSRMVNHIEQFSGAVKIAAERLSTATRRGLQLGPTRTSSRARRNRSR